MPALYPFALTFLSPLAGLIAAAIALPALFVLYFLRLRRRVLRVSSTLFWESATRDLQVNVPWQRLRPSWLLLLQLLALIALLVALARPIVGDRADATARTILLIDRSASMSALDAPGTTPTSRLDAAKARARELIDRALGGSGGGSGQVAIITFAGEPLMLAPLTSDRRTLLEALDRCTPTDQPGDLQAALSLASTLLAGGGGGGAPEEAQSRPPGLVILLSDGSLRPPADRPGFTVMGGDLRFEPIGPRGGGVGAGAELDNLGIVAIAARADTGGQGAATGWRLFARLQNAGTREQTVPLVLTIDPTADGRGRTQTRTAVTVPGRAPNGPPGEHAMTLELPARASGVATIQIARPDALASDNTASIVLAPPSRTRILLVVPDQPGVTPADVASNAGPSWVIADVLRELPDTSLRIMPASAYAASSAERLGADVVVFDRSAPATLPPLPTLSFGRPPTFAGLTATEPPAEARPTPFLTWTRTHPALRDATLDAIQVDAAWHIAVGTPAPGAPIDELAQGRDGPLILELRQDRRRHLVVAFEPGRSTWPMTPAFAIFLASSIEHLAGTSASIAANAWTTAQNIELAARAPAEISLDGPARITASARAPGPVSLGRPELAGVYRASSEPTNALSVPAVAVNLADAMESAIGVEQRVRVSGQDAAADANAASLPRELWPWFVAIAGTLLVIEWWLSGRWMRV